MGLFAGGSSAAGGAFFGTGSFAGALSAAGGALFGMDSSAAGGGSFQLSGQHPCVGRILSVITDW